MIYLMMAADEKQSNHNLSMSVANFMANHPIVVEKSQGNHQSQQDLVPSAPWTSGNPSKRNCSLDKVVEQQTVGHCHA